MPNGLSRATRPEQPDLPRRFDPILLVSNDIVEVMNFKRAFRELRVTNPLQVIHNGGDALRYFATTTGRTTRLVLVDLGLPGRGCHRLLAELSLRPELRSTTALVLLPADHDRETEAGLPPPASGALVKPRAYTDWVPLVRTLLHRWGAGPNATSPEPGDGAALKAPPRPPESRSG